MGVSGTKELAGRPGLAALLDRLESNGVQTVVVERADRLARDLMVQEVIVAQFAKIANGDKPIHYGLIAEEVERVLPELVAYNADGEVETVKYHVLPTLLLAELQRLEQERVAQAAELAALRATVDRLQQALRTASGGK